MRSFISLPILKKGTFLAGTATASPFLGFLAILASLCFTSKTPKPRSSTRSPLEIASLIVSKKTLTILEASFLKRVGSDSKFSILNLIYSILPPQLF